MQKFLNKMIRNMVFIIPASMLVGFIFGITFNIDFLHLFIIPCAFLIVYPMMVNLKMEDLLKGVDVRLQITAQVLNFCVVPFVAFGIGLIFFRNNPSLLLGLMLIGILPAGGGTVPWTGIAKGRVSSAIKMVAVGPLLGVILAPFYIKMLAGTFLEIKFFVVIKQLLFIIVFPMMCGLLTRRLLLKNRKEKVLSVIPSFSTVGIVFMVFTAMALKAKTIFHDPLLFLYILLPVFLLYIFNYTLSNFIGKIFFSRESTIALVYGVSMRNLSISMAVSMSLFGAWGSSAALVIAIAYIIHVQAAAWYAKLSNKIFRQKEGVFVVES